MPTDFSRTGNLTVDFQIGILTVHVGGLQHAGSTDYSIIWRIPAHHSPSDSKTLQNGRPKGVPVQSP